MVAFRISKRTFLEAVFLFAVSFLIYSPTLNYAFVWDDFAHFVTSDAMRRWENLPKFFTTPYWVLINGSFVPYHRPLVPVLTLLIDSVSGLNPFGYHFYNVCAHSLNTALFYLCLLGFGARRLTAVLAGLLFAVHPLHVEAAAWASCGPVLTSSLLILICLLCSHQLRTAEGRDRWVWLSLSSLSLSLSLMLYHLALVLPLLVGLRSLLLDRSPKLKRHVPDECILYTFLIFWFMIYAYYILRQFISDLTPYYHPLIANVVTQYLPEEQWLMPLNIISRYAENLVFPTLLSPDYSFLAAEIRPSALASLLFLGLASFWISRKFPVHKPLLFYALAWMLVSVIPYSGLIPTGGLFADRYAYLMSMGYCLWFGLFGCAVIETFAEIKKPLKLAGILIICAAILGYGAKTLYQSRFFENDVRLWYETSRITPHKARTHNNLGIALEAHGNPENAEKAYREAARRSPVYFVMAHESVARILNGKGLAEEAKKFQAASQRIQQKVMDLKALGGLDQPPPNITEAELDEALAKKHQS